MIEELIQWPNKVITQVLIQKEKFLPNRRNSQRRINKNNGKSLMKANDSEAEKYQVYIEERKLLIEQENNQSHSFDKYILTLSSGALALSVTFLKIMKSVVISWFCLLIISWGLFVFTITIILVSFILSQKACEKQRLINENYFFGDEGNNNSIENNKYSFWVEILNYTSVITFILGVIFFLVFATHNLNNDGVSMGADNNNDRNTRENKIVGGKQGGIKPPKPPVQPKPNTPKNPK